MSARRAMPAFIRLACMALACSVPVSAHHAPNSFMRLDFRAQSVRAEVMVPQSELAFAMNTAVMAKDGSDRAASAAALPAYLLRHVGAVTAQGRAWAVTVTSVLATTYLDQPYFAAVLELVPPAGGSTRDFVFTSDAITHEVRNHVVFVVAERDYADAALAAAPQMLGALQYPARALPIHRP
jgi:hypothetical protein